MKEAGKPDVEMDEDEDVPIFYDRIMRTLQKKIIVVGDGNLNEFPHLQAVNK